MPRAIHPPRRTYTREQKIALVSEIDRRYRAGNASFEAIAHAVGTTAANYHNWKRAGILAVTTPTMRPVEITALVSVANGEATAPTLALVRSSLQSTRLKPFPHDGFRRNQPFSVATNNRCNLLVARLSG